MGRINREDILSDGCYAHVFSRAIEKRYIFREDQDFKRFKEILLESKARFHYRIHHYCLMNTHFHVAVSMDEAKKFSEGLKWVKWSYARYFNLKRKRFGPLWRDRFKSLVIEDEGYLQACGRYIEGNPVEAGMVKRCEDWEYSSSRYYFLGKSDTLVDSYTFDGETAKAVNEDQKSFFTKGNAIGSDLFKLYCREAAMNVPS